MITVRQVDSHANFEYNNFTLHNKQKSNIKQPFLEPFDVDRNDILTQLNRMRVAFRHCLSGGVPLHREHLLHEQPQGNMGNYQEYVKNITPPLRDPDPDAVKMKLTFGNPWKRGRASESLDVDGFGFDGLEDRNVKQKRTEEAPKKRRRRTSSLSFRERRDRSVNASPKHSEDSDWSDTASNGSDVFIDHVDQNRLTNGFTNDMNGYSEDRLSEKEIFRPQVEYVNGNGIEKSSISNYSMKKAIRCKVKYDETIFKACSRLIRTPGLSK
jgi:integrator complex subunit 6